MTQIRTSFKHIIFFKQLETLDLFGSKILLFTKYFSSKPSLEIFPEVEKLLDSGHMKHRKHPGVKKVPPIVLPPKLKESATRIISEENKKVLQLTASDVMKVVASRRLPIEQEEIYNHIQSRIPINRDEMEFLPELLTKQELSKLRKEIFSKTGRWKPLNYDRMECRGYMLGRLVPNYASTFKIFSQIKSDLPNFQPETFFDFGSGIGSAVWAANALWEKNIKEYFCVDSSSYMNDLSELLLTDETSGKNIVENLYYRQFLPASESIKYDLVVSAFSLLDLPTTENRIEVIDTLWRKTKDVLVIIEFGNFAGFFSVLDARDYILQIENNSPHGTGAHILMPCPHHQICPMLKGRRSCGTHVSYQDAFSIHEAEVKKDWISYVVLRRGQKPESAEAWPRIVKPVLKKSGHVYCRMCCSDGKINEVVVTRSKHGRHAYRCARSSTVGDLLPVTIKSSDLVEVHLDDEEPNQTPM